MRRKMLQSASPANLLAAAMDAKEFVEKLPGRVNKVMDALAEGQITLNVQGIDERELMRGIQKLANRVTAGLIIAALIVGAAMMMRIDTSAQLFGYPSARHRLFPGCGARRRVAHPHQPDARPPAAPPATVGRRRASSLCGGHIFPQADKIVSRRGDGRDENDDGGAD